MWSMVRDTMDELNDIFFQQRSSHYDYYSLHKQEPPLVLTSPDHSFHRDALATVLQLYGSKAFRHPVFLLVPASLGDSYSHNHRHCLLPGGLNCSSVITTTH